MSAIRLPTVLLRAASNLYLYLYLYTSNPKPWFGQTRCPRDPITPEPLDRVNSWHGPSDVDRCGSSTRFVIYPSYHETSRADARPLRLLCRLPSTLHLLLAAPPKRAGIAVTGELALAAGPRRYRLPATAWGASVAGIWWPFLGAAAPSQGVCTNGSGLGASPLARQATGAGPCHRRAGEAAS
jgi:hypothetical protein